MAFQHGRNCAVLIGASNLSAFFNSADFGAQLETHETTTFGASAKSYAAGLLDGTASLSGLYDGADDAVDEVLSSALANTAGQAVTIAPMGAGTLGNPARVGIAHQTDYSISASVGDMVQVSAELQATGGLWGALVLATLAARTASANSTSIDNGASSANGAVANLHVTAVSGTTPSATIKVQHSTDNSVWADLMTFTAATAATSEQKTVTGTVNRYVRVVDTITGTTPSITYTVAFGRK